MIELFEKRRILIMTIVENESGQICFRTSNIIGLESTSAKLA